MAIKVLVTIPEKDAETLAKKQVAARVCACVNILRGVKSYLWWQEKIDTEDEALLVIKTKDELFPKLEAPVKANHPYEVPEIIAFKIDHLK